MHIMCTHIATFCILAGGYVGVGMGNWENEEFPHSERALGEKIVFKNLSSFEILFQCFIGYN